ncbi:DsrE/DsrF-like family protein [Marinobacterium sp. xm-g-59]|uniref:DsrE family protein n=1 Tax=Marinobacterium sp. xm-g-59 TaxID=2497748 RepID=UPI001569833D|nr:DsrE family protein [Marinobacterium sp. xm-g-59]NRP95240.1 DsrE/DsrF-like family protein [Marinobacterium sp. xm-g-59]
MFSLMFKTVRHLLLRVLLPLCVLFSGAASAKTVKEILALEEAPPGVVFEILAPNPQQWQRIQPRLMDAIDSLRSAFPDLDIAVVSHGNEQFALTTENESKFPLLHQGVRDLGESGVDVHVCETFASWSNVTAEAFPDYVDVAPSGPAQINNYVAMGYLLVDQFAF